MNFKARPAFLFFILYFFEGAPIGLLWWVVPTLMAAEGFSVDIITQLTALAAIPWTFKFLIAPLVDRYFTSARGHARAIAGFQFLMLLAFLRMLNMEVSDAMFFWLCLSISLFSAAQDVFIDAWAIGSVPEAQRGRVNGAMQAGMLSGRWLFGSGLLIGLAYLSWPLAIGILSALLGLSILNLVFVAGRDQVAFKSAPKRLELRSLGVLFERKILLLAAIATLTGFAFESFGAIVGPFLIGNGFDKQQTGFVLSGTLVAMLLGALGGGRLADRWGPKSVFLGAGLSLCVCVPVIGFLHSTSLAPVLIAAVLSAYLLTGAFTAGSYAFYMGHAKGEMEATRFTFIMAMTNLSESLAAFSVGKVIAASSYATGLLVAGLVSLLGLALLWKRSRAN